MKQHTGPARLRFKLLFALAIVLLCLTGSNALATDRFPRTAVTQAVGSSSGPLIYLYINTADVTVYTTTFAPSGTIAAELDATSYNSKMLLIGVREKIPGFAACRDTRGKGAVRVARNENDRMELDAIAHLHHRDAPDAVEAAGRRFELARDFARQRRVNSG